MTRHQPLARSMCACNIQAGMTSINDFGSTYMCQSLPFGGVKDSGFDRFAGIEGLRGLCVPKAVCQDRYAFKLADHASVSHQPVLASLLLAGAYRTGHGVTTSVADAAAWMQPLPDK